MAAHSTAAGQHSWWPPNLRRLRTAPFAVQCELPRASLRVPATKAAHGPTANTRPGPSGSLESRIATALGNSATSTRRIG